MKKLLSLSLCLILITAIILSIGSCMQGVSIENASINADGELIVSFTDGSEKKLGKVVGKDGENGIDGINGESGINGENGIDGKSAYEIYVSAHPEYTKDEEAWLADLAAGRLVVYESIPAGGSFVFATISDTEYRLYSYTGYDRVINIPSTYNGFPVVEIGSNVFRNNTSVKKVNIPSGIKHVDGFYGSGIESLVIPDGVTSIGSSAFYDCQSLRAVYIPKSVTEIGGWAFAGSNLCSSLVIYCEAESQPAGWAADWNSRGRTVLWGQSLSDMVVE